MFAFIIITHYHCHRGPRRRWRRRWRRLRRILRTFLGTLGEIASDLFERAPWLLYVLLTPSWSSSRSQRWHWYNHQARAESQTETDRQPERSLRDNHQECSGDPFWLLLSICLSLIYFVLFFYFFYYFMLLSLIFVEEGFLFVFCLSWLGCACICLA